MDKLDGREGREEGVVYNGPGDGAKVLGNARGGCIEAGE